MGVTVADSAMGPDKPKLLRVIVEEPDVPAGTTMVPEVVVRVKSACIVMLKFEECDSPAARPVMVIV